MRVERRVTGGVGLDLPNLLALITPKCCPWTFAGAAISKALILAALPISWAWAIAAAIRGQLLTSTG